jgi:hypothetical protein
VSLIVGFRNDRGDRGVVTTPEADPDDRPALLGVTPSAERVGEWLETLAVLAALLALFVGLFTVELVGRL